MRDPGILTTLEGTGVAAPNLTAVKFGSHVRDENRIIIQILPWSYLCKRMFTLFSRVTHEAIPLPYSIASRINFISVKGNVSLKGYLALPRVSEEYPRSYSTKTIG